MCAFEVVGNDIIQSVTDSFCWSTMAYNLVYKKVSKYNFKTCTVVSSALTLLVGRQEGHPACKKP